MKILNFVQILQEVVLSVIFTISNKSIMSSQFIVVNDIFQHTVVVNVSNIAFIRGQEIWLTGVEGMSNHMKEMTIRCEESTEEIVELINKATGQNISLK